MVERLLNLIGTSRTLTRFLVRSLLQIHSLSYRLASYLSVRLEGGGVHPKHRLMRYHEWFIRQMRPEWRVLDVGCGIGALAADLAPHAKEVVGIDFDEARMRAASKRHPKVRFIAGDATKIELPGAFDAIVLSNVLEHIEDRIPFLQKLSARAPKLLIRVPLIDRDWTTLYKRELGLEYRLDSTHFIEYTHEEFLDELKRAGLRVEGEITIQFGELYATVIRT